MKTLLLLVPLLLLGCATSRPRPQPLTQANVISLAKAGTVDDDIIRRIDVSRYVFRLGAADVVRLRQEGVSDRVINIMLDTYVQYSMAEQRRQDYYDYDWHYRLGFWYAPSWHCR